MTYIPDNNYGNGSDGDVTISADTDLAGVRKQYNNLTIDTGYKLYDSTGVLSIRVKEVLILNGDIDQSEQGALGGDGANPPTYKCNADYNSNWVSATPGGIGIYSSASLTGGIGGQYSYDTNGQRQPPSAGATPTDSTDLGSILAELDFDQLTTFVAGTYPFGGGGGAGGSGACYSGRGGFGGNGGAGGGVIVLAAKRIAGSGSILAKGGNGTNGTNAYSPAGDGGGGAGGMGGLIKYKTKDLDPSVTVSAAGGTGGSPGAGTGYNGAAGASGLTGIVISNVG